MKPTLIYIFVFVALLALVIYLQKRFCILSNQSSTHPKPYSFSRWQLVWWTFIIFAAFISLMLASGQIPTFTDSTLILLGIGSLTTVSATLIDISDNNNEAAADAAAQTTAAQQPVAVAVAVAPAPVAVAPVMDPAPVAPADGAPTPAPAVVVAAPVVVTPPAKPRKAQDIKHGNFLMDILSDKGGISIHRLQAFVFNLLFGLWFIYRTYEDIGRITVNSGVDAVSKVIPVITPNNLILLGVSAGLYATLKTTENK